MKTFYAIPAFLFMNFCAGQEESIYLKGGFAHFDDTDGVEVSLSYNRKLNRYLDVEVNFSYARTSNYPSNYNFLAYTDKNYWYTKSNVYGITPLLNIVFIREPKHYFSFYGGIGVMFIDTADSANLPVEQNGFIYQAQVESQTALSKSIGLKYLFYVHTFGFGLDAKLLSPIKRNDAYFGQDNYRSVNLILSKTF